ncbi:DUF4142 domain-containing protein [Bosea thiooxidans]
MTRGPHRFRRALAQALCALALSAMAAFAQTPVPPQEFVERTAIANMFGVESATLALRKTSSPAIKAFGHRLADDHAAAMSSLRRIVAKRSDIALPDRPDAPHLALLSALADKQGADFDKAYIEAQRGTYRETAALMERYANEGTDAELKSFAAQSLPLFRELDRKAQELPSPP